MAYTSNHDKFTEKNHPLMEQNIITQNQTNKEYRSTEGDESILIFNNSVTHGETFLENFTIRLEKIENDRKFKIQGLIQEVEHFRSEKLDLSNHRMLAQTERFVAELRFKLHESSYYNNMSARNEQDEVTKPEESLMVKHSKSAQSELTPRQALTADLSSHITQEKPAPRADVKNINLLLVGSEGNGKSATGNSILGKDAFKVYSSASTTSTRTKINIAKDNTEVEELSVNVIDGLSIHHSGEEDQEFLENIINSIEESLGLCDYAFTAILIVLKLGIRFTKQEAETIKLIKSLLGHSVIKEYGICVVTHGDNFENDVEDAAEDGEVLTFESWCRDQSGNVKSLFDECNFRCILFDNKTKDVNKKQNQRLKLLDMVNPNKRYSKEEFVKAEGLKELTYKALLPQLEQQTKALLDQVSQKVEEIDAQLVHDPYHYSSKMKALLVELQTHHDTLQEFGQSTPSVVLLSHQITALQNRINSKIKQQEMLVSSMTPAASTLNKERSLMKSNAGIHFSGKPATVEIGKLQEETDELLYYMWYEIKDNKVMSRQQINYLLERLKKWKEHVESVGQNSSSVDSILINIAKLELELQSRLKDALYSSQREHAVSSNWTHSAFSSAIQYRKGDSYLESEICQNPNQLEVVGVDNDGGILAAVEEQWRKIRQYYRLKKKKIIKSVHGYFGSKV